MTNKKTNEEETKKGKTNGVKKTTSNSIKKTNSSKKTNNTKKNTPKKEKKVETAKVEVKEVIAEEKKKDNSFLTTSLIMGVIGIILLLLPEESNKLIGYVIGGVLILVGIVIVLKYFMEESRPSSLALLSGVLYAVFGLIVVLNPLMIMKLATIILGIYLIVNGALKVHSGYIDKDTTSNSWLVNIISGVIIVVFGLILIINPFSGLLIATKVAGTLLLIVAIYDLLDYYIMKK